MHRRTSQICIAKCALFYCTLLAVLFSPVFSQVSTRINGDEPVEGDYEYVYENAFGKQSTQYLTQSGVDLRTRAAPLPYSDQVKNTGFTSATCDPDTQTFEVIYTNALHSDTFGEELELDAKGRCTVENGERRDLIQDEEEKTEVEDKGVITTYDYFSLVPTTKLNFIQCDFQLFLLSPTNLPQLISVIFTDCDASRSCGFWDFSCKVSTNTYRGSAVFWYIIYAAEMVFAIVGGFLVFLSADKAKTEEHRVAMDGQHWKQQMNTIENNAPDAPFKRLKEEELDAREQRLNELEGQIEADVYDRGTGYGKMRHFADKFSEGRPGNASGSNGKEGYERTSDTGTNWREQDEAYTSRWVAPKPEIEMRQYHVDPNDSDEEAQHGGSVTTRGIQRRKGGPGGNYGIEIQ